MSDDRRERLEAIRRELEKQEEAWERLQVLASRVGDAEIAVPRAVLEQILGTDKDPAAPPGAVRA
ncbi:MAG TPA: hypothetical protein VHS09_15755 [Polyangiaceae bacterium]|jgi:hypothetical protein|nr:hypothetical protein [Polyangiaceae bacterium]